MPGARPGPRKRGDWASPLISNLRYLFNVLRSLERQNCLKADTGVGIISQRPLAESTPPKF